MCLRKKGGYLNMNLTLQQKTEIEQSVLDFCKDCNSLTSDAIDIVAIARQKGFEVQRLTLGHNTTGLLLCDQENLIAGTNTNKLIVVKKGLNEYQSRLIVAHELGHYSQMRTHTQISHREYSRLKTNEDEQKADYFARAILMPKGQTINLINTLKKENKTDKEIISKISEYFRVTINKANIRYYEIKELYSLEMI